MNNQNLSLEQRRINLRKRALALSKSWVLARCTNPAHEPQIDKDLWKQLVDSFEKFLLSQEPHLKNVRVELHYNYSNYS